MSRNSIAALAGFTFLWNWEDYLWPFLMITDDDKQLLSVGLKMFSGQYGTDYGGLFAATSVTIIPVVIVYLVFQKQFIAGIATGSRQVNPAGFGRIRTAPAVSHQSRGAAAASLVSS